MPTGRGWLGHGSWLQIVADAYVRVHTEDDTRAGRDKIGRETESWSKQVGDRSGRNIASGIGQGLLRGLRSIMAALLRFTIISSIVGLIGAAISALAGYVVQLYGVLGQLVVVLGAASGALLLFPAIIATMVGAIVTLKLAFSGFGEALKAGMSGDLAAFEQALSKLAPAAQEAARALVALKEPWEALKQTIQEALFLQLGERITELGTVYIPILERGLGFVAHALNLLLHGVASSLLDPFTQRNVLASFSNIATVWENIAKGIEPLLTALLQVISVLTGVFADYSDRFDEVMQGWADALNMIQEDQWAAWIEGGIEALKLFGSLIADVGGILTGLFKAAGAGDAFGWLDRLNDWINSAEGMQILTSLFTALRAAADALSPAFFELGRVLVPILEAFSRVMVGIGPALERLVGTLDDLLVPLEGPLTRGLTAIGDILADLFVALAPGLAAILEGVAAALEALVPVAEPVGRALSDLLIAVTPLIPAVGKILAAALQGLADILTILSPLIAPVTRLIESLVDAVVDAFTQARGANPTILEDLVRIVQDFANAVRPAIPVLAQFVSDVLTRMLDAFMRVQPQLMEAFEQTMTTLADVIPRIVEGLAPQLPAIADAMADLAVAAADFLIQLAPLLPQLATLAVLFITQMLPVLIDMVPFWIDLIEAATDLLEAITTPGPSGYSLLDAIIIAAGWMIQLSTNTNLLRVAFAFIMTPIIIITNLVSIFAYAIRGAMDLVNFFGRAIGSGFAAARQLVAEFVANAVQTLAGLPGSFYNIGVNIVWGLISGIQAMLGTLRDQLLSMVANLPYWAKKALGIASPSKVFAEIGKNTMLGYILGLQSQMPTLQNMMSALATGSPQLAFAGGGTPGGSLAAAMENQRPIYVAVQVGDKPVREMVQAEIVDSPEVVASAAQEGDRRAAVSQPSRKRVGSR